MNPMLLRNFTLLDETGMRGGSVIIEDGCIRELWNGCPEGASFPCTIDGGSLIPGRVLTLMPALVDLHAHFRDPGGQTAEALPAETVESAALAAAAGGYGTVVCMANTKPPIDTLAAAADLKARSDALGLIDLYPALSLTRGMAGRELSEIARIETPLDFPRLLSEDGKDVLDDGLFLAALREARRLKLPVSCHCDAGGGQAEAAKQAGEARRVWSRVEENAATRRALELGRKAGAWIHIAHVSTQEAAALIRSAKKAGGLVSAEAAPHHIALTEDAAQELGEASYGRVNPPLRTGEDRRAVVQALMDGTLDAVATDHAPHTQKDKAAGAPGFSGLETSFAVCLTALVKTGGLSLPRLSALMSAAPARILGLTDRGRIAPGYRGDLCVADTEAVWTVQAAAFRSRGKNTPYQNREVSGRILMTIHRGRIVYETENRQNRNAHV